jgi:hypothetical protein
MGPGSALRFAALVQDDEEEPISILTAYAKPMGMRAVLH